MSASVATISLGAEPVPAKDAPEQIQPHPRGDSPGSSIADLTAEQRAAAAAAEKAHRHAQELHAAEFGDSQPPVLLKGAFDPAKVLGGDPAGWVSVFQGLAPKLPAQLHCEPFAIADFKSAECQPVFTRTIDMLTSLKGEPELEDLMRPTYPETGEKRRARIKMRMADKGKFMHRNRYKRRQVICCLYGEQTWLFASPDPSGGGADEYFASCSNDNWNGFRSTRYPSMLSIEQMQSMAAELSTMKDSKGKPIVVRVLKVQAGDVLAFDGRFWHGTSYSSPLLNMFVTPGEACEIAVKEQKRRAAMPMQKGLALARFSMAKVVKLSDAGWDTAADGSRIAWESMPGHIAVSRPSKDKDAADGSGDASSSEAAGAGAGATGTPAAAATHS